MLINSRVTRLNIFISNYARYNLIFISPLFLFLPILLILASFYLSYIMLTDFFLSNIRATFHFRVTFDLNLQLSPISIFPLEK